MENIEPKPRKIRSITIKLTEPIEWGDETITELVLKRPKAIDLEHLPVNPTVKDLLSIAQKCAKVPRRIIQELDSEDAMTVVEAVSDFLDGGQPTGVTRSY